MAKEYYPATVSRVDDPKRLGRIRVTCQALAAYNTELPFWVEPVLPFTTGKGGEGFGWFSVPEVGSEVELEVATEHVLDETPGETFFTTPDVKYRAAPYSGALQVPSEFKENYPKRRGLKTTSGHTLIFDDQDETVTIATEKGAKVVLTNGGEMVVTADSIKLGSSEAAEALVLGNVLVEALQKLVADPAGIISNSGGLVMTAVGPGIVSPAASAVIVQWVAQYLSAAMTNILSGKAKTER